MPQTRNKARPVEVDEVEYNDIVLNKQIGQGNFGLIYKATLWGQTVALKMLKEESSTKTLEAIQEAQDDFNSEVKVLRQLRHPNIVEMLGVCMQKPKMCIVTEFCTHGSLQDWLTKTKLREDLPVGMAVDIAIDVASGLNWMHHKGFMHRDIKPENILVSEHHSFKLADMGLTQSFADAKGGKDYFGDAGTYWYMSPEVLTNSQYTCKSDCYSFGVFLCELLNPSCFTEAGYFDVKADSKTVHKRFVEAIQKGLRPQMPDGKEIPAALRKLLTSCLVKGETRRPTMDSILTSLRSIRKEVVKEMNYQSVARYMAFADSNEHAAETQTTQKKRGRGRPRKNAPKNDSPQKTSTMEVRKLRSALKLSDQKLEKERSMLEKEVEKVKALEAELLASTVAKNEREEDFDKLFKRISRLRKQKAVMDVDSRSSKRAKFAERENIKPRNKGMLEMLSNPFKDITNPMEAVRNSKNYWALL